MRRLTLIALALGAAILVAACGSSDSALVGKSWKLTGYTENVPAFQGVVPAADQARYTVTFNDDDTFNGTADCNQVAGTFKTSGSDGLTIEPTLSTMAFTCRAFWPVQTTKTSVNADVWRRSSTMIFSAFFAEAARTAAWTCSE